MIKFNQLGVSPNRNFHYVKAATNTWVQLVQRWFARLASQCELLITVLSDRFPDESRSAQYRRGFEAVDRQNAEK